MTELAADRLDRDGLRWLDATEVAERIRAGDLTPAELLESTLRRVDALNPTLNAVVGRIEPGAAWQGPFAGVPLLVKDLALEVAGTRFTEGSRWLADHVSSHDQELTRRFRRAGFVLIGKTNTPEFGLSATCEPALFGPARNPFHLGRSTGGSSGGAAAAVAAGIVPVAHGNDLLGSIRIPAAHCGVFGLKPSRARVSLGPEYGDVVSGLASEHVLTRTVRDSAAVLDAVAGRAPGDPYCAPEPARAHRLEVGMDPGSLRIAVSLESRGGGRVHPEHQAAMRNLCAHLEALGHVVEEGSPDGLDDPHYDRAVYTLSRSAAAWIAAYWERRLGRPPREDELEPATRAWIEDGRRIGAAEYLLAVGDVQRITRKVAAWFFRYDLWLTPTTGAPPAPLGVLGAANGAPKQQQSSVRHFLFDLGLANVTGHPAMSIPWGLDIEGLPIGMHFLGRYGDEATLLRLAAELERSRPWQRLLPVSSPRFPAHADPTESSSTDEKQRRPV